MNVRIKDLTPENVIQFLYGTRLLQETVSHEFSLAIVAVKTLCVKN